MGEVTHTFDEAMQILDEPNRTWDRTDKNAISDAVQKRLNAHITICAYIPDPRAIFQPAPCIPQRSYCQGSAIPSDAAPQSIFFLMNNGKYFPAEFALTEKYGILVEGSNPVFPAKVQTINLRIEWPGYDGWGSQIRTVNYQAERKGITRAKLLTEIAKQLVKFIEEKRVAAIDPAFARYRVGPGGIELSHIGIAALEQASRGSWQPRFVCYGL